MAVVAFVGVAALVGGAALLLRDKPGSKIEDRLDLLTGANTPAAAKERPGQASQHPLPAAGRPAGHRRVVRASGSATSACCSSRPTPT